jgi:predicted Zn-dependent protease
MVGRQDDAIQLLSVAIRSSPDSDVLLEALAETYCQMGRFDDAIVAARTAIIANPHGPTP